MTRHVASHAPGRILPTMPRDADRPYGRIGLECLAALEQPRTVRETAAVLGWTPERAHSWVHHLRRRGQVRQVGWVTTKAGNRAGRYQRVGA